MILGEMKIIVDCWWRETKSVDTAQLYNLTADPGEWHDLAHTAAGPALLKPLLQRLEFWEAQSVPPYQQTMVGEKERCGEGKPQGTDPAHWDSWC